MQFADSLYQAATSLPPASLPAFLDWWCNKVISELATDLHGYIGQKMTSLASNIPQDFLNIHVLFSYIQPITSLSEGHPDFYADLTWTQKEPLIPEITRICEFYFEWGFETTILKWFHKILWPSVTCRVLCRQLLSPEDGFLSWFAGEQSVTEDFHDWMTRIHSMRTRAPNQMIYQRLLDIHGHDISMHWFYSQLVDISTAHGHPMTASAAKIPCLLNINSLPLSEDEPSR